MQISKQEKQQIAGNFYKCKKGATSIEYAIIGLCIAVVCVIGLFLLHDEMEAIYGTIDERVEDANQPNNGNQPGQPQGGQQR